MLRWPRSSLRYLFSELLTLTLSQYLFLLSLHFSKSTSVGSYLIWSIIFPPCSSLGFLLLFDTFWASFFSELSLSPQPSLPYIFSGRFLRRTPALGLLFFQLPPLRRSYLHPGDFSLRPHFFELALLWATSFLSCISFELPLLWALCSVFDLRFARNCSTAMNWRNLGQPYQYVPAILIRLTLGP